VLYFLGFTAYTSLPRLLSSIRSRWKQPLQHPILSLALLAIAVFAIHYTTYAHPYLLADNRHLTFYIWRRWFMRHWLCKYLLAPVYVYSFYHFFTTTKDKWLAGVILLATTACVVLAGLLELRYFIVPYTLWRLGVSENKLGRERRWVDWVELALNLVTNSLVLYLFLYKPFKWPHNPEHWQRIMW